jgi:hypothetical protein
MITIANIGNCNVSYISGLRNYLNDPEGAMLDLLTAKPSYGHNYDYASNKQQLPGKSFRKGLNGIYLFAQGSDDSVGNNSYAAQFKDFIEQNGLGKITGDSGQVKNVQHNNKCGRLYMWVINWSACKKWWAKKTNKQTAAAKADSDAVIADLKEEIG